MLRTKRVVALALVLGILLLALSFSAGYNTGMRIQASPGLSTIEQAWRVIYNDYVDKDKLDAAALSRAAIQSMVQQLNDPYTGYIDAENRELTMSSLEGKYSGIGAEVGLRDNNIVVIAPLPDSPAAEAGVRAGDVILEVDGTSTSGMGLVEVVTRVRGPSGTTVSLLLIHEGEDTPVELDITRADIDLASVDFDLRDDIAYIRITQFTERTNDELTPVMEDLSRSGATGIVLDLRGNPGGNLTTVVDVASQFLEDGVVVDVVDNQGKHTTYPVEKDIATTDLPMVVLVDNYSASGSEVLVGVLQDYHRATVAGTKTFGKGSVNILRQLDDGSVLYITTARWLTPNGRLIEGEGLEPDIELELTGEDAIEWAIDYLKGGEQVMLPVLTCGG